MSVSFFFVSLWGYVVIIPFFTLVYYAIVKNEESYLKEKFGTEYAEYCARVNRFIPNFSGLKHSLEQYQYDWRKVLSKEYGTIALLLSAILILLIWKDIMIFGYAQRRGEIQVKVLMFVPIALFYGTARYLKKTRRLEREQAEDKLAINQDRIL